jgi:hypothetical protein
MGTMGQQPEEGGTFHGGGTGNDKVETYYSGVCTGVEKGDPCPVAP